MPTISVAMIVKNEAADLAQCLDTVKDWVDEIIIVDSGSTDNTQEIAEQYGVTRQAVFDNIKKGVQKLDEYENKLGIFKKEKELKKKLEYLKKNFTMENLDKIIEDFDYAE